MKPKLIILFAIFLLDIHMVYGQSKEVRFLIDTTLVMMKRYAVNSNNVNWDELEKNTLKKVQGIDDAYKIGPAIRYLYESINDFHGRFYYKDSIFQWYHSEPVVSDSIMNEWKKGATVRTAVLESDVGYLRIPGMQFSGREGSDRQAQNLNDSLCALLNLHIKGLIIDLRLNGGGAMYPMILGVQQLLQHGQIGSFQSEKNEKWYLSTHDFKLDTTTLASITPKCDINGRDLPIVMLISPPTGSSAEFFIIAFKGRAKTMLLGSKTAGYVTGVEGFPIDEAAYILLSTSYGVDRQGNIYKEAIEPDIPFAGADSFNNISNDDKVKEAVKWLKLNMK